MMRGGEEELMKKLLRKNKKKMKERREEKRRRDGKKTKRWKIVGEKIKQEINLYVHLSISEIWCFSL